MQLIDVPGHLQSLDASVSMYPSTLTAFRSGSRIVGAATSTTYGFVVEGRARVATAAFDAELRSGSYVCAPGPTAFDFDGLFVAIERHGFRAPPCLGSVEERGRLSYIDGCSDTILCMPPRAGDPVLNHLHFPAGIEQSPHRHPSIRLGVVARGHGMAHGPGWRRELAVGCIFLLDAHESHAFSTSVGAAMDVIAFHPDSDWGPTDGSHPMLNRTYVSNGR